VLSGILPISRISAVPACVYAACQYLPLESILKLAHPREGTEEDDRRTWRDGVKRERQKDHVWTAMDILVMYADLKGWQTAKAGRPDIHRAGNASELGTELIHRLLTVRPVLRALAEGKIAWAFWPPDVEERFIRDEQHEPGAGIWIPGDSELDDDVDTSEPESLTEEKSEVDSVNDEVPSESDSDQEGSIPTGLGRFGALAIVEGNNDSNEETGSGPDEI
jgi:hypothetical protein